MTLRSLSVLLLLAACGVEAEDGELDSLSQNGKADGGFSETELAAAVRVANELSLGRFLKLELNSVPDIDLDFPRDIREKLIVAVNER